MLSSERSVEGHPRNDLELLSCGCPRSGFSDLGLWGGIILSKVYVRAILNRLLALEFAVPALKRTIGIRSFPGALKRSFPP